MIISKNYQTLSFINLFYGWPSKYSLNLTYNSHDEDNIYTASENHIVNLKSLVTIYNHPTQVKK